MVHKLKPSLTEASQGNYALGHFNFSTLGILRAVVLACQNLKSPVFVGTSEGEAKYVGYKQAVALVRAFREETGLPIFLNADHHKTFENAKIAIDAGYDSVQIDETKLSFEENMKVSRQVVEYAKSVNSDISIEGGLGYIRGSSEVHKEKIEVKPEDMTTPEEAKQFVADTGVDRLAIVFGNIHGVSSAGNPRLDIDRLKIIHKAIPDIPLTLHGGSGISDEDIKASLSHGMSNIHVNTEIRVAYSNALRVRMTEDKDQTTPYKYLGESDQAARKIIENKLKLFRAVDII
jgi:fructose-bisphosphate aldolase, class II